MKFEKNRNCVLVSSTISESLLSHRNCFGFGRVSVSVNDHFGRNFGFLPQPTLGFVTIVPQVFPERRSYPLSRFHTCGTIVTEPRVGLITLSVLLVSVLAMSLA